MALSFKYLSRYYQNWTLNKIVPFAAPLPYNLISTKLLRSKRFTKVHQIFLFWILLESDSEQHKYSEASLIGKGLAERCVPRLLGSLFRRSSHS